VRRGSIFQLVSIGLISGAIATAIAVLVPWMPTTATEEADRIDFTYWFATVISLFVFAIVAAVLIYSLINFRVKPGDFSDGPPVHGHTTLEIVWTIVPAILVTAIAIVSAIVLAKDDAAGANPLRVNVYGQQFFWSFDYPGYNKKTSTILRLPVNRSVVLTMHAKDVLHSFWVPEFRQKQDLVPGLQPTLHITPDKVGTYPLICTELCGLGHALMRSRVIVMKPDAFEKWAEAKGP